jgi:hypothetical protein
MRLPIFFFVVLFGLPMATIIVNLPLEALRKVELAVGLAVLLAVAVVLLPRLLRRLSRRRDRVPTARALTDLAWPESLNRSEMETFCFAWLHAQGWTVSLATDPDWGAEGVYLMAHRGGTTIAVLCDPRGEELNPAAIRAFAQAGAQLGATGFVLLSLPRNELPSPAQAAARQAGVTLLRVADLPQLNALAPAPAQVAPAVAA